MGVTYEQVQRAMAQMPDLVDIVRTFEPQLRQMAAEGRTVTHDLCTPSAIGFHWLKGN